MGLREKWLRGHYYDELLTTGVDRTLQDFTVREYVLGEHLYQVDQPCHEMYLLLSGTVIEYLECDEGTQTLATLHAPDFVGEMACLRGEAHTTNAMVTESCRVLVIPDDEIDRTVTELPRWFVSLLEALLKRLSEDEAQLACTLEIKRPR